MKLYHDNFQNYKRYQIPKAQLIIADIPYNLADKAYASSRAWFVGGDSKKGRSDLAGKSFFDGDENFNVVEFMHFVNTMLKKEPKEKNQAGCMIIFCEFEQQFALIELGKRYGFPNYINLVFRKNYSPQVLKANMRIVGNAEYGLILYRNKLPKFRNGGKMIFNIIDYERDTETPKIHPTQKSVPLLRKLISIFTDPGDVVIDPVAGSGTTLFAAASLGRKAYGFEVKRDYVKAFNEKLAPMVPQALFQTREEFAQVKPRRLI